MFGSAIQPRPVPPVPLLPSPQEELLSRLLAALGDMRGAIAAIAQREARVEVAAPVDLTRVVQAVTDLGGSFTAPTAEQIAEAIAKVLHRDHDRGAGMSEAFAALTKTLRSIDSRIMGMANQVYGGGSVAFSDEAITRLEESLAGAVDSVTIEALTANAVAQFAGLLDDVVADATITTLSASAEQQVADAVEAGLAASDLAALRGSLANGAETTVDGTARELIAANGARKAVLVQNTGVANMRVGITGVTATTGFRVVPNGHIIFVAPTCTNAVFAIREGAVSTVGFAQEVA